MTKQVKIKRCGVPAALCRRLIRQSRRLIWPLPRPKRRTGCYISQLKKTRPVEDLCFQDIGNSVNNMQVAKPAAQPETAGTRTVFSKEVNNNLIKAAEDEQICDMYEQWLLCQLLLDFKHILPITDGSDANNSQN